MTDPQFSGAWRRGADMQNDYSRLSEAEIKKLRALLYNQRGSTGAGYGWPGGMRRHGLLPGSCFLLCIRDQCQVAKQAMQEFPNGEVQE